MYALRTAVRAPLARAPRAALSTSARWNKDAWATDPNISFNDFNKLVKQPSDNVLLIDTREPDEAALSPIPGTVNLPFSKLADALKEGTNPGKFQNDFAFSKPTYNQKIVFLDKAAKRSTAAAEAAKKAGYDNVRTFSGGVSEYQDKSKKQ